MSAEVALESLAWGLAMAAALAAGFTAVAWRVRRRTGTRGLVRWWLGAGVTMAAVATTRAVYILAGVRQVTVQSSLGLAALYMVVFVFGFGAIAWRVNARIRNEPEAPLTFGSLLGGTGLFFAALLLLGFPLMIWDASRLFLS